MISKKMAIVGFAFLCLAQWYIAGRMIGENEKVIRTGAVIKLRTAPIDPNDPFRGKYITLNFSDIALEVDDASIWQNNDEAYITFREDQDGFHLPDHISPGIDSESTYLKVRVNDIIDTPEEQKVYIEYPFDRFYLEEKKAPEAEQKYLEALADPTIQTYAKIYVQDGKGMIDNVFIGDLSIMDVLD